MTINGKAPGTVINSNIFICTEFQGCFKKINPSIIEKLEYSPFFFAKFRMFEFLENFNGTQF